MTKRNKIDRGNRSLTTIKFPDLSEAEIIQDNEKRWQDFQQNPNGIPHAQVEAWFANRNKLS